MQSSNRIVLAAAGAGKTTEIVAQALGHRPQKSAIVTFTLNNTTEIRNRIYEMNGSIPPEISIYPWYTFVLRELARPYQGALFTKRIKSVNLVGGRSAKYIKKSDVSRYYFDRERRIYTDKIGDFAIQCNDLMNNSAINRLSDMFGRLYIDEVQDLAGYDLDVVEMLLKSKIAITLVGDVRQTTYRTNYAARHQQYVGLNIAKKFSEWEQKGICTIDHLNISYRCHRKICELADSIFPGFPKIESRNLSETDHDGVFLIGRDLVRDYVSRYSPQVLRLDRKTDCDGYNAMNFGEAKGLGFERVLIYPYKKLANWLLTGDKKYLSGSPEKIYVGVTRAKQSVAFVFDGVCLIEGFVRIEEV